MWVNANQLKWWGEVEGKLELSTMGGDALISAMNIIDSY